MKSARSARSSTSSSPSAKIKPRERLLSVACRLFYQHGLRATGIDWIIAEAGVAKMSFYRHFPSKNHLIAEYLRLQHEFWMKRLTEGVEARSRLAGRAGGLELLAEVLTAWFEEPSFQGCPFIKAQAEVRLEDEQVRDVIQNHQQAVENYLTELFIQMGYSSPRSLVVAVLVILQGSIVQAQISADAKAAGEASAALLRKLSRALHRIEDESRVSTEEQLVLAL